MQRVGLGIVGAGNVSLLNVPGYLCDPRCAVVAVCDPRIDLARERASAWKVSKVYRRLEEMLADPDVDAVEVLSPTYLHAEHVIAAAAAGKHVSCQKPIANSVRDARAMFAACQRAGITLRVTENCCYYPPLQQARELIRNGAIGAPTVVRIKTVVGRTSSQFQAELDPEGYFWRLDGRSPGGHLFDDVMHKYAMAIWLVDCEVRSVQAVVRKGRLVFEAPTVALLEYDRADLLGTIEVAHAPLMFIPSDWYGADEFFEVQGTSGFIWVTRCSGRLHDLPPLIVRSGAVTTQISDIESRYETSFQLAAAGFIDGLLAGTQPDLTPEAAISTLRLAFAVYQASRERRPINPSEIEDSVSPPWWPKDPAELIDDASQLGLLPNGMSTNTAEKLLHDQTTNLDR